MTLRSTLLVLVIALACVSPALAQAAKPAAKSTASSAPAKAPASTTATPSTSAAAPSASAAPAARVPKEYAPLMSCVGEWDLSPTVWLQPGMAPIHGTGRSTIRSAFGSNFVEERSNWMLGATAVESGSFTSWDAATQHYDATRFSSTVATAMSDTGSFDTGRNAFTFNGAYDFAGIPMKQHSTLSLVTPDSMLLVVMLTFGDGPEYKGAEVGYRRRK